MISVQILLVEDNPDDLELTLRALRKNNIANDIQIVRDGEEALRYLFREGQYANRQEGNPQMILLDLKLPKIDGLEVLRQLRADSRTRTIPVVVLTSSREERDIVESYNLGVNSYVVKPVEFDKFISAVSEVGMYWLVLNQRPSVGQERVD